MMRNAERSSGSDSLRLILAAVLALLSCAGPAAARPQEVEDLSGDIEKYQTILTLANQKLDDLELPEALAGFTEVIDAYKTGKLSSSTTMTRQLVGQSLEGRARTHANLGNNAQAEADFEALVRFDVTWPVDRTRTSPKIIGLYDKVRSRIVGTLVITSVPAGAVVTLNGEPLGRTPLFDKELTSGSYTVQVQAPGFDPISEVVELAGGARIEKLLRLAPNARSILVATSPAGAKLSIDGQQMGVTFGLGGPQYADWAAKLEIGPTDVSAPLLVENLSPGAHMMKLEKECFEPQLFSITVAIDPNDFSPLPFEPIRLAPSLGTLSVTSTPPGGEILVDGKSSGRTPARLEGICTGRHELIVKNDGIGQWIGAADVARGQVASIAAAPRMTLAFVGMTEAATGGGAPESEKELGQALAGLKRFNVIGPGAGLPDDLLARGRPSGSLEPSPDYLASVASRTGADLVVVAKPGEGAFERKVEILLQPAQPALSLLRDRRPISLDTGAKSPELAALVTQLDTPTEIMSTWLGVMAIDIREAANPVIVRVNPASSAAAAGAKKGDGVVSLGGKPVARARDLVEILSTLRAGAQASLSLQAPGQPPRQVNVVIGSTPRVVLPAGESVLVSSFGVEMVFQSNLDAVQGREGAPERTAALLSLAETLMRAGSYEAALTEALDRVKPAAATGLATGTVQYLKGLCLFHLGRLDEARQQLTKASAQPDATLWREDGPPVAERARRLLASLPPA